MKSVIYHRIVFSGHFSTDTYHRPVSPTPPRAKHLDTSGVKVQPLERKRLKSTTSRPMTRFKRKHGKVSSSSTNRFSAVGFFSECAEVRSTCSFEIALCRLSRTCRPRSENVSIHVCRFEIRFYFRAGIIGTLLRYGLVGICRRIFAFSYIMSFAQAARGCFRYYNCMKIKRIRSPTW